MTTFVADVADEAQLLAFRDAVAKEHVDDLDQPVVQQRWHRGRGQFRR